MGVVVGLLMLLIAGIASGPLRPWVMSRELVFDAAFQHAASPWNLEWTARSPSIIPNGHWLTLSELGDSVQSHDGRFSTAHVHVTRSLPWYDLASLRITWTAPAPVRISDPRVITRFFGWRFDRQNLAEPASDADGIRLSVPTHRWVERVVAGVGAIALMLCGLAGVGALVCLERAWARWVDHPKLWRRRGPGLVVRGGGLVASLRLPAWSMRWWPAAPPSRLARWGCFAIALLAPACMMAWTPLLITGDGTAYLWLAIEFTKHLDTTSFDGWRLPGYALLLTPLLSIHDLAGAIGLLQALLGVGTSLLAFVLVRRRSPGWAPYAALALVALDPMVLAWQRLVLSETLTSFVILLGAWLAAATHDRLASGGRTAFTLLCSLTLGVVVGYGAIVRGNLQVIGVLAPLAILLAGLLPPGSRGDFARPRLRRISVALSAAGLCGAGSFVVVWPWVHRVQLDHHRTALTVGPGFSRQLQSWQNGTIDWDQSGVMSYPQIQNLRERLQHPPFGEYDYSRLLLESKAAPTSGYPNLRRDVIGGIVADESFARRGDAHAVIVAKAVLSHLGVRIEHPAAFHSAVHGWLRALLFKPFDSPTTLRELAINQFPREVRLVLLRAIRPLVDVTSTPNGRAFALWWRLWDFARPALSLAFLIALVRLARRGDVAYFAIGLWFLANTCALAILVYAGEDRYAMPFYPLVLVVLCAGLAPGRLQTSPNA